MNDEKRTSQNFISPYTVKSENFREREKSPKGEVAPFSEI